MKSGIRLLGLITVLSLFVLASGCGVSKSKYEELVNRNMELEEKVSLLTKARDALKGEYDNLLNEKMDLSTRVKTVTDEKAALKSEYDKILDEKISLKAAYDKVSAESKKQQSNVNAAR